jgi:hypothetical protein
MLYCKKQQQFSAGISSALSADLRAHRRAQTDFFVVFAQAFLWLKPKA